MSRDVQDWVIIDDIAVSITRAGESPDSVWKEFAKDLEAKRVTKLLGGATTDVAMTSVQRKIVSDVLSKNKIKVIAVTDDRLARGVITAVSWLGVNIRAFSWAQVREGAKELGVPEGKLETIVRALLDLKNRPVGHK